MKYNAKFQSRRGDTFTISSMEDYVSTQADIKFFSDVLSDAPVYQYITKDAIKKYGHPNTQSLAVEILNHSALRWTENKERRFLLRNASGNPVGMIGVTLKDLSSGELWYYKMSSAGSLMREALVIALDFLSQEGIKELIASVEPDNTRSIQILSVLGFKKDKQGQFVWHRGE